MAFGDTRVRLQSTTDSGILSAVWGADPYDSALWTPALAQGGGLVARPTGDQAITSFGEYQRRRNLSPLTIKYRRARLRSFAGWLDKDLLDATTKDIEKWLDHHSLSPQARCTYTSWLAAFFGWALTQKFIRKDPTVDVIRPKLPKRVPRPIDRDDLAAGVESADPRMRCWLLLAGLEGMRCAEIAAMRVEDIHREHQVLLIHGKGNKERLVPLHPAVLRSLTAFGLPRAGYCFPRRDGKPLSPSTVSRGISQFLHSIGVDATAHRARHGFATWLYQLSGDLRLVQDLLGHSTPASTAQYAAWAPARAAEVVSQLSLHQD